MFSKDFQAFTVAVAHQIAPKIEHSIMTDPDETRSSSVELHKHLAMQLTQHGDLTVWS